jgi:predicted AAA+ superfamily ATPase
LNLLVAISIQHRFSFAGKYPVVTIAGPRQSGKTTLVKAVFPRKTCVNLENLEERGYAQPDPRGFFNRLPGGAILDEVRRVPNLLSRRSWMTASGMDYLCSRAAVNLN